MTKTPLKDVGASVRARLLQHARAEGDDFQQVLTRYANERLLYRLACSPYANLFVLKGAALFTLWAGKPHRATRDLDFLGFGDPSVDHLRQLFATVLSAEGADDGVHFDHASLTAGLIRKEQAYGGVRLETIAHISSAKVRVQVDVGFGDTITPEAQMLEFPALLDFPAPRLRTYPRETVVAEKLEAMVQLGMANSRMKDFYDLAVLARDYTFDGELLCRAICATFNRRKTQLPTMTPVALTSTFVNDPSKQAQWAGFVRKTGARDFSSLAETATAVALFLEVLLKTAAAGTVLKLSWPPGGPWRQAGAAPI